MTNAVRSRPLQILAMLVLVLCAIAFLQAAIAERALLVGDPTRVAALSEGDAQHYLYIAESFTSGDLGMSYVRSRPHRQPLYPAALAFGQVLFGDEPVQLLYVNITIAAATVLLTGLLAWRLFASALAGIAAAAMLASSPFLLHEGALRLLTEPLYTLCMVVTIHFVVRTLRAHRTGDAAAASAGLGLAYLTRPNGLFLFAAAMTVMTLHLAVTWWRQRDADSVRRLWLLPITSVLVFFVVTLPSTVPRLWHCGSAFYHGYLPNYLWVDTYAEGHVSGPPRFTIWDYVANHTWADAAGRMQYGLHTALIDVPMQVLSPVVTWLMALGLLLAMLTRRGDLLWLAVIFFLQMLPIAWTQMSNPSTRIPAAATLPFGLFYAGYVGCLAEGLLGVCWGRWRLHGKAPT